MSILSSSLLLPLTHSLIVSTHLFLLFKYFPISLRCLWDVCAVNRSQEKKRAAEMSGRLIQRVGGLSSVGGNRHMGVTCDGCGLANFTGIRHKYLQRRTLSPPFDSFACRCVTCFDYDLCHTCATLRVMTKEHSNTHPLQTIVAPVADFGGRQQLVAPQKIRSWVFL